MSDLKLAQQGQLLATNNPVGQGSTTGVNMVQTYPYIFSNVIGDSMIMSTSIRNLAPALLRAQTKMVDAVKDSKNPFFKSNFADLNSVREACTPSLHKEGILLSQPVIQKDGKSYLRTLLIHAESGEYLGSDVELLCAKQNDPQAMGSSISYARRYGLQALVSLGAIDDDGNSSSAPTLNTKTETKKTSFTQSKPEGWT